MERIKDRAVRMIENYAARLRVGQCAARAGDIEGQAERYAAGVERTRRIRAETIALLGFGDMPAILHPLYVSFALNLGRVVRSAWGEHARLEEARILVTMWQTRGLQREAMLRIAREVFELELDGEGK